MKKKLLQETGFNQLLIKKNNSMSNIGKIIRVNALPPVGEREINVIYQVAAPGAATYTDYAIDANGDLKTHAVVDGSIPVELSDDHVSISDLDLIAEGITSQAEYNSATIEKLHQKLDKPTNDGNVLDYPKIVGLDDNGNIAKLPAGDLGKNVANSSLTSVAGAGLTLGADWALNTSGKNYTISGLSDVSNDSAFNTFLSQNTSGKVGKTNGKQPFLSLPSTLSNSEKTAWKTAMNGGWTTNTMSVFSINPSVIKKEDKNTYVSLYGTNLNLNPASFSVEILNESETTVLAVISNSQVQLSQNGLELIFYYNFKNFSVGNYKVRLWNGVAYYTTPVTFSITNSLTSYDLSNLTWDVVNKNGLTNNTLTISNTSVSGRPLLTGYTNSHVVSPLTTITSSSIGNMADDFIIEIGLFTSGNTNLYHLGGLSNEITPSLSSSLVESCFIADSIIGILGHGSVSSSHSSSDKIIFTKRGISMQILVKGNNAVINRTLQVTDDPAFPIKLKLILNEINFVDTVANLQLVSAYKIN